MENNYNNTKGYKFELRYEQGEKQLTEFCDKWEYLNNGNLRCENKDGSGYSAHNVTALWWWISEEWKKANPEAYEAHIEMIRTKWDVDKE